jgi:hypothetical protein
MEGSKVSRPYFLQLSKPCANGAFENKKETKIFKK